MSKAKDECLTSIGFMFEGSKAFTVKHFEWKRKGRASKIYVTLSFINENPGALQSGHYLWPAAPALVQHLILQESSTRPTCIVELGAGCALVALAALQLFSDTVECMVVTDHDPGTLTRARDNRKSTLNEIRKQCGIEAVEKVSSSPFLFESLSWGDENDATALLKLLQSTTSSDATRGSDLILGSDLIYCMHVVKPLLKTVSILLKRGDSSKFLLSQSFAFDDETEATIHHTCDKLGLQRAILLDTLKRKEEGIRIQTFQWKKILR